MLVYSPRTVDITHWHFSLGDILLNVSVCTFSKRIITCLCVAAKTNKTTRLSRHLKVWNYWHDSTLDLHLANVCITTRQTLKYDKIFSPHNSPWFGELRHLVTKHQLYICLGFRLSELHLDLFQYSIFFHGFSHSSRCNRRRAGGRHNSQRPTGCSVRWP